MSAIKLTETNVLYSAAMYDQYMAKSGIRLGQHLCNTYGITDAEIFYEKDSGQLVKKFINKYALR